MSKVSGFCEGPLVAVAGPQVQDHHRPLGDDPPVQLDLTGREPRLGVDDGVVAHHLGEDVLPQLGVRLHVLELVGPGVQHVEPHVGDGLVGGVATGGEQEGDEALDLVHAHPLAVELGGDQPGEKVVARSGGALDDERLEVGPHLVAGGDAAGQVLAAEPESRDERLVPPHEPGLRPRGVDRACWRSPGSGTGWRSGSPARSRLRRTAPPARRRSAR